MDDQIVKATSHHPPSSNEVIEAHQAVRIETANMMATIYRVVPNSRERSVALTHLETAMMWANAGIARNQNG
jgi:hypothetical protein